MKERPILFSVPMVRAILAGKKTQTRRVLKNQPYASSSNPPRFRDTEPGDVFVCPDFWPTDNNNPGRVLVECTSIGCYHCMGQQEFAAKHSPYGVPGERLWVRETWAPDPPADGTWAYTSWAGCKGSKLMDIPERYRTPDHCMFAADYPHDAIRWIWKPSIHMPRWACRILLEVTGVRVERLQDISDADCWAEGIEEVDGTLDPVKICELAKRMGRCIDDPSPTFAALWESIGGAGSWDANPWVWVIEFRRVK